jgi:tetratricopeptide (TPR) repeat protein
MTSDDAQEILEPAEKPAPKAVDAGTAVARALAMLRAGHTARALKVVDAVLSADPGNAGAHNCLGMAKAAGEDLDGAIACYQRAAKLDPAFADAYNNMGNVLRHQERYRPAAACYRKVVELSPEAAAAHNNLGMALTALFQPEEAAASFHRALELAPGDARVLKNLGDALRDSGHPEDAAGCYEKALAINAEDIELHNRIGLALEDQGKMDEAMARYQQAIDINPDKAAAHCALGVIHYDRGRFEDAIASYERTLEIDPDHAGAHNNIANTYLKSGLPEPAIAAYRRAIAIEPEHAGAHINRALALLTIGDFAEGWVEHEWRWKSGRHVHLRKKFPGPFWDGAPLDGKTILLYGEQGRGDTIQFIRYAPVVAGFGGRVVVECYPNLLGLFGGVAGIDQRVERGKTLPEYDVHAPLLTLPLILGTTLETIPGDVGYITADAALVETWRQRMEALPGPRIGLCWQGNPKFPGDKWRSVPLRRFAPLFEDPALTFVNLHKGTGEEQIAQCGLTGRIANFADQVDGFDDTAAIMENLDLIITSDTSVAHVAGALGRPTWILLQVGADWRWMVDRDVCPWYPAMRLFRQQTLKEALDTHLAG